MSTAKTASVRLVPKYMTLESKAVYAGIPVRRIDSSRTLEI